MFVLYDALIQIYDRLEITGPIYQNVSRYYINRMTGQ